MAVEVAPLGELGPKLINGIGEGPQVSFGFYMLNEDEEPAGFKNSLYFSQRLVDISGAENKGGDHRIKVSIGQGEGFHIGRYHMETVVEEIFAFSFSFHGN